MATKVYQSGNFLALEYSSGNVVKLPLATYSYSIIGTDTIHFYRNLEKAVEVIPEQISTLQDQAGTPIGGSMALVTYLDSLTLSAAKDTNLGFAYFVDTVNDINNPQNVTAGTPVALTIVSNPPFAQGGADFLAIAQNLWTNNKITPDNSNNDSYLVRLSFRVDPAVNRTSIFISLDIGIPDLVFETSIALPANRSTEAPESVVMQLFAGSNFLANGGTIFIDGDGDFAIYDKAILIEKIRKT